MNDKFDISQKGNEIIKNILNAIPPLAKLNRASKKGTIIKITPKITQGKYDVSKYINQKRINKIIYDFYTILEKNFSHHNLGVFYLLGKCVLCTKTCYLIGKNYL